MNTFAHHTFLIFICKKKNNNKIMFHCPSLIMHHFVLVNHIKSPENIFTFVVKCDKMWKSSMGVNFFARHCISGSCMSQMIVNLNGQPLI